MYHGDPAHTGLRRLGQRRSTRRRRPAAKFRRLHTLTVGGPILSVPAVADGFVYVGLANSRDVDRRDRRLAPQDRARQSGNDRRNQFNWKIDRGRTRRPRLLRHGLHAERGRRQRLLRRLQRQALLPRAGDLSLVWVTDLRNRDLAHNQPVQTFDRRPIAPIRRRRAGRRRWWWTTASISASAKARTRTLYSFVYCLDAASGNVIWIFCTNQYAAGRTTSRNQLPDKVVRGSRCRPASPCTTARR